MKTQEIYFKHHKIIIGIPAYNEEKFILETLSSLIQQTWKDFSVVISDNASTDNTESVCREVCSLDNRFHYVRQPKNIGASKNFWFLYETSESPYFMWLGAHDVIDPSYLSVHLSILEEKTHCSLSYSRTKWINEKSELTHITDGSNLNEIKGSSLVRYLKSLDKLDECTAINQLIRRSALNGAIAEPVWGGDLIVLSRLLYMGEFNKVDKPLYLRRSIEKPNETQIERITGTKNVPERFNDFIRAYLDDFDNICCKSYLKKLVRPIVYLSLIAKFSGGFGNTKKRLLYSIKKYVYAIDSAWHLDALTKQKNGFNGNDYI